MSTFTHINQGPVFNDVARTTVPARWDHLLKHSLPCTQDSSLPGIARTIYGPENLTSPLRGEVWGACKTGVSGTAPQKTFKVTEGDVQMYVLSGSGSVTKNGKVIFLRDGEKVSFSKDDTFSFPNGHEMRIFVRNEGASFSEGSYSQPISRLRPPTDEEVQRLRMELGVIGAPSLRPLHYYPRSRESASSAGYARSRVG
jgi:hypothetical protein